MMAQQNITDRAYRYRANRSIPNHAKVCAFCGRKNGLEVGHVNGDESDDSPDNLTWTCRPCNVTAANTLQAAGVGRLTNQYNPSKSGGATSVGEWMQAVGAITPHVDRGNRGLVSDMPVSEAVAIIRATPHSRRSQFAAQLRKHMGARSSERWNGAQKNIWPFSDAMKHGSVPAHGGIAAHAATKKAAGPKQYQRYRGYTISKTPEGEYFSSLDPDSWYETPAKVRKSIDDYKKGRGNPAMAKKKNPVLPVPLELYDVQQLDSLGKGIFSSLKSGGGGRRSGKHKRSSAQKLGPDPRRNPENSAARMYQEFHGRPSSGTTEVVEDVHYHENLAELGKLRKIKLKPPDGGTQISLRGFGDCLLCSNEDGTQLYIRGGDQSVPLEVFGFEEIVHDFEDLGAIHEIRYFTTKDHLGDEGGTALYFHELNEEDLERGERPRRPRLIYDTRSRLLSIAGGAYRVLPEGIAN